MKQETKKELKSLGATLLGCALVLGSYGLGTFNGATQERARLEKSGLHTIAPSEKSQYFFGAKQAKIQSEMAHRDAHSLDNITLIAEQGVENPHVKVLATFGGLQVVCKDATEAIAQISRYNTANDDFSKFRIEEQGEYARYSFEERKLDEIDSLQATRDANFMRYSTRLQRVNGTNYVMLTVQPDYKCDLTPLEIMKASQH